MLFLLNDVVFRLDGAGLDSKPGARRFQGLEFPAILRMGQELYAKEAMLQRTRPEQARRLASLISAKAPMINAALFITPSLDCSPGEVTVRFLNAPSAMMTELYSLQRAGDLDTVGADRRVWRRLAA